MQIVNKICYASFVKHDLLLKKTEEHNQPTELIKNVAQSNILCFKETHVYCGNDLSGIREQLHNFEVHLNIADEKLDFKNVQIIRHQQISGLSIPKIVNNC